MPKNHKSDQRPESFEATVMAHLGLLQAKADHQSEALDLIVQEVPWLRAEGVARARATLGRASRGGDRARLRLLGPPPQAHPRDRQD
jgi:hypothetical protein